MSYLKKNKQAFTLVEILVVILIIGLLFVFLVPKIASATGKARETGIKTDMRSYQTAIDAVAMEHGGLGTNAVGSEEKAIMYLNGYLDPALKVKYVANSNSMETAKLDPWNNPYLVDYIADATGNNNGIITVRTMGKDMRDTYDDSWLGAPYQADVEGNVVGHLGTDLEYAWKGGDDVEPDDYITCTWYIDGRLYKATSGFTSNMDSDVTFEDDDSIGGGIGNIVLPENGPGAESPDPGPGLGMGSDSPYGDDDSIGGGLNIGQIGGGDDGPAPGPYDNVVYPGDDIFGSVGTDGSGYEGDTYEPPVFEEVDWSDIFS